MHLQTALLGPLLALSASSAASIIATRDTPLLGPVFLSNFDPSNSKPLRTAKSDFPNIVEGLFKSDSLNSTDLVFAVDVFSAATNKSLYSYYHVGEGQNKTLTSGELNDETIFRIGSVTKLFTTYAILAKAGIEIFSHPVTKYLPELAGNSSDDPLGHIHWEDVTVGALAAQQAGSGGATDFLMKYAKTPEKFTSQEFLKYMRDAKHPVISPFRTAVYSDAGYSILGQVLRRISGQSYGNAMEDVIFEPLGLDHMSVGKPAGSDINAVNRQTIDDTSSWGTDIDIVASSGGIYGSAKDLRTAGLSILNSELLSAATTREWMKPHGGTGSLVELVGAPWEIARLTLPATPGSNRTRICDLYTKAGGNGDYTTIFALSPDHGIGFSILVAGSTASAARWVLREAVGATFISAAEHAAVENARLNLAGKFANKSVKGTNLTLSVDVGSPGLGLESIYIKNVESSAAVLGVTSGSVKTTARLYPTGPNSLSRSLSSQYTANGTIRVAHRMVGHVLPLDPRPAADGGKGGYFDTSFSWENIDFYGPLDEFIFELVDGKLVSVASTGEDLMFERVE